MVPSKLSGTRYLAADSLAGSECMARVKATVMACASLSSSVRGAAGGGVPMSGTACWTYGSAVSVSAASSAGVAGGDVLG